MKKLFSDEQEKQICNEYFSEENPSTIILGKKWSCSNSAISNIIKRNGYKVRTNSEASKGKIPGNKGMSYSEETKINMRMFSKEEERQIYKQYKDEKVSCETLSKRWNCSDVTIGNIIKKLGKIRTKKEAQNTKSCKQLTRQNNLSWKGELKKFSDKEEQEIKKQYCEERIGSYGLAKHWNCNHLTIRNIVIRNGGKLRSLKEAHNTESYKQLISGENNSSKRPEVRQKMRKVRSEETKQKIRENTIRQLQNYSGPYKDTKPELKMKEILNDLNIPFEHQYRLENHLYDFHILNTNILIEVDGDYWHGNIKKFSKLNDYQLKQKEKDLKNSQLAKSNNFTLFRFWEDDILHNTEIVKTEIRKIVYEEKTNK